MQKQKQTTTILLTIILLTTTITTAQNFPTTPEIEAGKEYRLPITHPNITLQLLSTDSNHRQATIRYTIHTQDGFYTYYDDTKHTNTPFTNTNPEGTLRDGLNDALEDPTTGNPRPWDINNPDLDQLEPVAWPRDGANNAYILLVWQNKNRGIVRYPQEDGYDYPNQDYYDIGDYFRPTWIGRIADGYDNGAEITPPGPGVPPEAVALAHEMQMLGSGRDMPLLVSTLTQNEEIIFRAKVLDSQDVTIQTETPSNITFSDRPATLGTTIYRNIELGEFWGVAYAINLQNYATRRNGAEKDENIKILGEEYQIVEIDPVNAEVVLEHPTKGLITLQDNQPAPTSLVPGPGTWTMELDFVDNKLSWLVLHSLAGTTRNLDQNPVEGPWMSNGDPYFVISAKDFTTSDPTAKIFASMTQISDATLSEGRSVVLPLYGDIAATLTLDSVMGSSAVLRWEVSGDDYFKVREVEENVDLYNIQDENIWPWVNITVDGQFELIWETEPNPNTVRIFSENRQDNPDPTPDLVRKVGDQYFGPYEETTVFYGDNYPEPSLAEPFFTKDPLLNHIASPENDYWDSGTDLPYMLHTHNPVTGEDVKPGEREMIIFSGEIHGLDPSQWEMHISPAGKYTPEDKLDDDRGLKLVIDFTQTPGGGLTPGDYLSLPGGDFMLVSIDPERQYVVLADNSGREVVLENNQPYMGEEEWIVSVKIDEDNGRLVLRWLTIMFTPDSGGLAFLGREIHGPKGYFLIELLSRTGHMVNYGAIHINMTRTGVVRLNAQPGVESQPLPIDAELEKCEKLAQQPINLLILTPEYDDLLDFPTQLPEDVRDAYVFATSRVNEYNLPKYKVSVGAPHAADQRFYDHHGRALDLTTFDVIWWHSTQLEPGGMDDTLYDEQWVIEELRLAVADGVGLLLTGNTAPFADRDPVDGTRYMDLEEVDDPLRTFTFDWTDPIKLRMVDADPSTRPDDPAVVDPSYILEFVGPLTDTNIDYYWDTYNLKPEWINGRGIVRAIAVDGNYGDHPEYGLYTDWMWGKGRIFSITPKLRLNDGATVENELFIDQKLTLVAKPPENAKKVAFLSRFTGNEDNEDDTNEDPIGDWDKWGNQDGNPDDDGDGLVDEDPPNMGLDELVAWDTIANTTDCLGRRKYVVEVLSPRRDGDFRTDTYSGVAPDNLVYADRDWPSLLDYDTIWWHYHPTGEAWNQAEKYNNGRIADLGYPRFPPNFTSQATRRSLLNTLQRGVGLVLTGLAELYVVYQVDWYYNDGEPCEPDDYVGSDPGLGLETFDSFASPQASQVRSIRVCIQEDPVDPDMTQLHRGIRTLDPNTPGKSDPLHPLLKGFSTLDDLAPPLDLPIPSPSPLGYHDIMLYEVPTTNVPGGPSRFNHIFTLDNTVPEDPERPLPPQFVDGKFIAAGTSGNPVPEANRLQNGGLYEWIVNSRMLVSVQDPEDREEEYFIGPGKVVGLQTSYFRRRHALEQLTVNMIDYTSKPGRGSRSIAFLVTPKGSNPSSSYMPWLTLVERDALNWVTSLVDNHGYRKYEVHVVCPSIDPSDGRLLGFYENMDRTLVNEKPVSLQDFDILYFHSEDPVPPPPYYDPNPLDGVEEAPVAVRIGSFLDKGGLVVLTGSGALVASQIGVEDSLPTVHTYPTPRTPGVPPPVSPTPECLIVETGFSENRYTLLTGEYLLSTWPRASLVNGKELLGVSSSDIGAGLPGSGHDSGCDGYIDTYMGSYLDGAVLIEWWTPEIRPGKAFALTALGYQETEGVAEDDNMAFDPSVYRSVHAKQAVRELLVYMFDTEIPYRTHGRPDEYFDAAKEAVSNFLVDHAQYTRENPPRDKTLLSEYEGGYRRYYDPSEGWLELTDTRDAASAMIATMEAYDKIGFDEYLFSAELAREFLSDWRYEYGTSGAAYLGVRNLENHPQYAPVYLLEWETSPSDGGRDSGRVVRTTNNAWTLRGWLKWYEWGNRPRFLDEEENDDGDDRVDEDPYNGVDDDLDGEIDEDTSLGDKYLVRAEKMGYKLIKTMQKTPTVYVTGVLDTTIGWYVNELVACGSSIYLYIPTTGPLGFCTDTTTPPPIDCANYADNCYCPGDYVYPSLLPCLPELYVDEIGFDPVTRTSRIHLKTIHSPPSGTEQLGFLVIDQLEERHIGTPPEPSFCGAPPSTISKSGVYYVADHVDIDPTVSPDPTSYPSIGDHALETTLLVSDPDMPGVYNTIYICRYLMTIDGTHIWEWVPYQEGQIISDETWVATHNQPWSPPTSPPPNWGEKPYVDVVVFDIAVTNAGDHGYLILADLSGVEAGLGQFYDAYNPVAGGYGYYGQGETNSPTEATIDGFQALMSLYRVFRERTLQHPTGSPEYNFYDERAGMFLRHALLAEAAIARKQDMSTGGIHWNSVPAIAEKHTPYGEEIPTFTIPAWTDPEEEPFPDLVNFFVREPNTPPHNISWDQLPPCDPRLQKCLIAHVFAPDAYYTPFGWWIDPWDDSANFSNGERIADNWAMLPPLDLTDYGLPLVLSGITTQRHDGGGLHEWEVGKGRAIGAQPIVFLETFKPTPRMFRIVEGMIDHAAPQTKHLDEKIVVAFLLLEPRPRESPDFSDTYAALDWLRTLGDGKGGTKYEVREVLVRQPGAYEPNGSKFRSQSDLESADVIWFHHTLDLDMRGLVDKEAGSFIRKLVESGKGLVLTGAATYYAMDPNLRLEDTKATAWADLQPLDPTPPHPVYFMRIFRRDDGYTCVQAPDSPDEPICPWPGDVTLGMRIVTTHVEDPATGADNPVVRHPFESTYLTASALRAELEPATLGRYTTCLAGMKTAPNSIAHVHEALGGYYYQGSLVLGGHVIYYVLTDPVVEGEFVAIVTIDDPTFERDFPHTRRSEGDTIDVDGTTYVITDISVDVERHVGSITIQHIEPYTLLWAWRDNILDKYTFIERSRRRYNPIGFRVGYYHGFGYVDILDTESTAVGLLALRELAYLNREHLPQIYDIMLDGADWLLEHQDVSYRGFYTWENLTGWDDVFDEEEDRERTFKTALAVMALLRMIGAPWEDECAGLCLTEYDARRIAIAYVENTDDWRRCGVEGSIQIREIWLDDSSYHITLVHASTCGCDGPVGIHTMWIWHIVVNASCEDGLAGTIERATWECFAQTPIIPHWYINEHVDDRFVAARVINEWIMKKLWITEQPEQVFVARGDLAADAAAIAPLAAIAKEPIVLVEPGRIPEESKRFLDSIRTRRAVIVGGPKAVSPAVESQLAARGFMVERVWSEDRFGTAQQVALKYWPQGAETAVLVPAPFDNTTIAEVLVAVPLAHHLKSPLLLLDRDRIPDETVNALEALNVKRVILVGTTNLAEELANMGYDVDTLAGKDKYETSLVVGKYLEQKLNFRSIAFINGEDPGAYNGAHLAAFKQGIVLLIPPRAPPKRPVYEISEEELSQIEQFVKNNKFKVRWIIFTGTLDEAQRRHLIDLLKPPGAD